MNKRISIADSERRLLSIEEAAQYIGQGLNRTRSYMESIGAVRKIGRRVLFDKKVIDEALDQLCDSCV